MGERIHQLHLNAFRGVPQELLIDFGDGQSIAVYGDNGTGKSTIADALEWYLTGEIELLAHEGRRHAVRNLGSHPDRPTWVELKTTGSLSGKAVFPDATNSVARGVAGRETFLLRGRTLADFINKTKTEKWKALAEILGLDAVDKLRQDLQRVRTELRKKAKAADEELRVCQQALAQNGDEVGEDAILSGLQQICRGLGIESPDSLDRVRDPVWMASFMGRVGTKNPHTQRQVIADDIQALEAPVFEEAAFTAWNDLVSRRHVSRHGLLKNADLWLKEGSQEGECPLCGQEVDPEALAARIKGALLELQGDSDQMEAARLGVQEQLSVLAVAFERREELRLKAGLLNLELPPPPRPPHVDLAPCLESQRGVDSKVAVQFVEQVEAWDDGVRELWAQAEASAPQASDQQLVMLVTLCQQILSWRVAEERAAEARRARQLADSVYTAYQKRQQAYLGEVLTRINTRVAEIYESLHPGEGLNQVCVEPWTAKGVELAIDFHGSRQRPPHGVLSESHLNSLAIALFLAMAETFNENLHFLVLDDVINSFDLEHRGSLASLLARKSDWQLIVLTHDHQFYEHLTRRAPWWKKLELTSWSYDEGPRTTRYLGDSLVTEARERLSSGDVNGAATKARRALEEQLQEVCEALQALLPFRRGVGNDRRGLGELFAGLRRALKVHAKNLLKELEPQLRDLEADVGASLNLEAHASRGRAASAEVETALGRIEELDRRWTCPECQTRVWFKGTPDSGRCKCGKTRFPPPS